MSEIIETTADGRYRVRLVADEDAVDPRRNYGYITHVITQKSSYYRDVDPDGGPLQYGWDYYSTRPGSEALFIRWARIFHGAVVTEHNPGRGPASLWYLMPTGLAEVTDPEARLRGDIAEYQSWADGEVYGYIVEEAADWVRKDGEPGSMTTWDTVEDLWGLIGFEFAQESARTALDNHVKGKS